jgi:hypothetical protein
MVCALDKCIGMKHIAQLLLVFSGAITAFTMGSRAFYGLLLALTTNVKHNLNLNPKYF